MQWTRIIWRRRSLHRRRGYFHVHAFWIPGWTATVDGKPARTVPTDAIGVVGVEVPAGEHQVRLPLAPRLCAWRRSWSRCWRWPCGSSWPGGDTGGWRRWYRSRCLSLLAWWVGRLCARRKHPPWSRLNANLGNKIGLQGFALDKSGDTLAVHLVWLARQPMDESYKVFIHVIDDQGKLLAQTDSRPQGYASNTNRWIPGQVIADRFAGAAAARRAAGALSGARRVV